MKCPRCQRDNRDGAKFCIACGESLQLEPVCFHCGHMNPQGSKLCDECGDVLVGITLDDADLDEETLAREKQLGTDTRSIVTSDPGKGDIHRNLVTELKEIAERWSIATGEAEKAAEQIARLMPSSQVDSSELQSYRPRVPGKVQMTGKIKVFLVDRDLLFSQGLCLHLSQTYDIEVIGNSEDFVEDTVLMIEELASDVVLVDANLPSLSGLDLARQLAQDLPNTSIIVLAPYEDDSQILEAFRAGVAGYLSKDVTGEELSKAIRKVFKGERIIDDLLVRPGVAQRVFKQFQDVAKEGVTETLSPREMEMLGYFAYGYSRQQVAHAMDLSEQEITTGMAAIVSKLVANGCNE